MNSWLDAEFRKAVAAVGRKKFVIAGLRTEACVMFPTLDMLKEGYDIYIPADACGDLSMEAHNRSMDRAVQAGAVFITSAQYLFELQQDWARSETYEGVMDILRAHSPYGIQVRFSKWALGEHASEAGSKKLWLGHESLLLVARCGRSCRGDLQPAQRTLARASLGRPGGLAGHSCRRADHPGRQADRRRSRPCRRLAASE
jgi:hypothetical protein